MYRSLSIGTCLHQGGKVNGFAHLIRKLINIYNLAFLGVFYETPFEDQHFDCYKQRS